MILDTNALSALADRDAALLRRAAEGFVIPVIALGEFRYGIAASRDRDRYEEFLAALAAQVLDLTLATAAAYAEVRRELREAGTPIPVNDLWIAALARQHRVPVLSRDAHFDRVPGLRRLVW